MSPTARERIRIEHARRLAGIDELFGTMLEEDGCPRCSEPWPTCLCDPSRPFRQPTEAEIVAARERRLARAERKAP